MTRKAHSTILLALAGLVLMPAIGRAADAGNTQPDVGQNNMLIGQDAFGGWQSNRPGAWRKIGAGDVPRPFATQSAGNAPGLVRRPADAVPQVPSGFKAELVASGLSGPRTMVRAPNGDIFVADSAGDRIVVLRMKDGQAKPAEQSVFAGAGLSQPYGIAFYPHANPQWVYVGEDGGVVRFRYHSGDLKASGKAETIVRDLPTGGHGTRAVAFSPDDATLFVAVGSASNIPEGGGSPPDGIQQWANSHPVGEMWGEEEGRAAVLSFSPDGTRRQVFATGLRNCSGLTVQPGTGEPWCAVNERDGLGDNLPFDYATRVRSGNFYGWPWYYIGANEDPRAPMKGQRPDLASQVTLPDVLFQAHSAPLGIAFYDGSQFPAEYQGDAFVTMHGSWNRASPTGYKVVRLKFDNNLPTGAYEDFVTGFVTSSGQVWGRPTGVVVTHDGSLLISEDGSGTIWRISYQKGG